MNFPRKQEGSGQDSSCKDKSLGGNSVSRRGKKSGRLRRARDLRRRHKNIITGDQIRVTINKISGFLGIDPDAFTLGNLFEMSHGRQEQEWGHTSQLLSFIHNGNCGKTKDMRTAAYFNPYATAEQKRLKRPGDIPADTTIFKKLLPLALAAHKDKRNKPSAEKRIFKPPEIK